MIPVAVAPIVLSAYFARAREGSERHAAFVATFATVNAAALVSTAIAVTSQADPGFENPRLHDRYLFYVVPLWLIVLVWWVRAGAPRPRVATRIGIGLAALLALFFPYWQLELQDGVKLFSAVGTAFPAALEEIAGSALAGAIVTLVAVGLLLAAVFRRPGVATKVVFGALVGVFLVNALLVWGRAFNPPEGAVFPGSAPDRRWVDERVPEGATVTVLESQCEDAILERDSYFLTEFFNDSIDDVVRLTENATGRVGADGTVVLSSGEELEARFVVAQPGLRLRRRDARLRERPLSSCSGRSPDPFASKASKARRRPGEGSAWSCPPDRSGRRGRGLRDLPVTCRIYDEATNAYGSGSLDRLAGRRAPESAGAVASARTRLPPSRKRCPDSKALHAPPGPWETSTCSKRKAKLLHATLPPLKLSAVAIGAQRPEEPRILTGFVTGCPSTHTRHHPRRPATSSTATLRVSPTATSGSSGMNLG